MNAMNTMNISILSNNSTIKTIEHEKKLPSKKSRLAKLMSMDKDFRSQSDIEYLYKEFKHLEYFKHLFEKNEDLILANVLKYMSFKEYRKHDIIYRHGEMGTHCYILIKGTVDFVLPQNKFLLQKSISNIINKGFNLNIDGRKRGHTDGAFHASGNKSPAKNSVVSVVHEGNIFGDKELADRTKRSYMAKCQTNCLIGELTKTEYVQIFENTKRLEYNDEIKFYYSINILKDCQKVIIDKLMSLFEKKHCKKGDIVCRQNTDFDHLYLIRRGDFEVVYTNKKNFSSDFDLNFFLKLNDNKERFTSSRVFELKESYYKYDNFKLIILGYGEFFGDIELKNKQSTYWASLICNTDKSEIYQCDKNKFYSQMPDSFICKLYEKAREREKYYRSRVGEIKKNTFKTNMNKYQTTFIQKNEKMRSKIENLKKFKSFDNSDNENKGEDKIIHTGSPKIKISKENTQSKPINNNLILRTIVTPKSALYRKKSDNYSSNTLSTADTNILLSQSNTSQIKSRIFSALPLDEAKGRRKFPKFTSLRKTSISKERLFTPSSAHVKSISTTNQKKNNFILQIEDPFETSQYSKINSFNKTSKHEDLNGLNVVVNSFRDKDKANFNINIHNRNNSLLYENSKNNYSKCFELNKKFFLQNNPSILSTRLENVFVACKVPKKKLQNK